MTDAEVTEEDSEQSEIVHAIRRIMKAEEAILQDDPADHLVTDEAQQRIFAALDRLTGGGENNPPTVLEAVIFERIDPLLRDWIDRYLPGLVERLVREEIHRRLSTDPSHNRSDSPPENHTQ